MGEPITKERLEKYSSLRRSVENQLERLARLKNAELIPAMKESDGSKRSPAVSSSKMEKAIVRRLTYEDDIMPDVEAKLAEMEAIRAAINQLGDPLEAEVLRFRYIDGDGYKPMRWKDVALQMYHDDDESKVKAAQRIHDRALESLSKLGQPEIQKASGAVWTATIDEREDPERRKHEGNEMDL